jgi:DNA-binding CsgD family transcriptional regulator
MVLGYIVIIIIAAVFGVITFLLWKKDGTAFLREALFLQVFFIVMLAADMNLKYFASFVFTIDPLNISSIMTYYRQAPGLYVLYAMEAVLSRLGMFFVFSVFTRLSPLEFPKRWRFVIRTFIQTAMGLSALEYIMIPLSYGLGPQGDTVRNAIDALNRYFIAPGGICVLIVGIVVWLRDRRLVGDKDVRGFGDGFLLSILILALVNIADIFIESLIPDTPNTFLHETMYLALWIANTVIPVTFAYAALALYAIRDFRKGSEAGVALRKDEQPRISDAFCAHYRLTAREREISDLLSMGVPNKVICQRLGISHGTVKNHVSNIFGKLKIQSRFELSARIREFSLP